MTLILPYVTEYAAVRNKRILHRNIIAIEKKRYGFKALRKRF